MADQLGISGKQQRLIASRPDVQKRRADATASMNRNENTLVVNASEKRYLWTARAFAVVTAISLCCNLILLLAIGNILPLNRVEPYLLTLQSKEDQVYRIVPYSQNMDGQKTITETFVRQYILLRSTMLPDPAEMESRWGDKYGTGGDLQEISSSYVYKQFRETTYPKAMENMRNLNMTSNVKIATVNEIGDNVWQVEYSVDYYSPTWSAPKTRYYRASLKIMYQKQVASYKNRLKNPVGFKVISYGTKQIKEKE